jgi:steroid 5-alpha reductase family enzyme
MDIIMTGAALILIYLSIMFTIVTRKQDTSIGNFTWGGLVMLMTLYSFFVTSSWLPRQLLATALTMLWGIRLAYYAYTRYHKGVDPRFTAWLQRGVWHTRLFAFAWIFILNGAMGLTMSLPISVINHGASRPLSWLDGAALLLWLVGFYFESVSDTQLYAFLRNPANKGKIMDQGLWRYSRHPNYFGEIVMWWAMWMLAIVTIKYPWETLIMISPVAITITLVFVTGIPWVEGAMANNPAYQEYKRKTSMLIPRFPKK